MPKKIREALNANKVKTSKEYETPGLYADGLGLYLKVAHPFRKEGAKSWANGGSKAWVFRYTFHGKQKSIGLGSVDSVTLAKARQKAAEARDMLDDGRDPAEVRDAAIREQKLAQALAKTFRECAETYIAAKTPEWTNAKHAWQWTNSLEKYVFPEFGNQPVAKVDTAMVVRCLEKDGFWTTHTETATRVRQRIQAVLDWATTRDFRTGKNPAIWKGHLDKLLADPAKIMKAAHYAALPFMEVAAFVKLLQTEAGTAAQALEFTILTAARTGEVINATWSEFDLAAAVWTVPAERMKAKKEHRVPLSPRELQILQALAPEQVDPAAAVFPGQRPGKPLSNMAMLKLLERMGRDDLTVHGFRSSFRDWAAEQTNYPSEVVEMALAHTIKNKVEAAYRRGDLFDKRALLMQAWATWCSTERKPATVTPLNARKTNTAA